MVDKYNPLSLKVWLVSPLWLPASWVEVLGDSSGKYLECRVVPSVERKRRESQLKLERIQERSKSGLK